MKIILLFFIWNSLISSLTAAGLDEQCSDAVKCTTSGADCIDGKCRCKAPWYKPCKSGCDIVRQAFYESESCETSENCVQNSICVSNICRCTTDFTAVNGVCGKSINTACVNGSECITQNCQNSRCACPQGYKANSDSRGCEPIISSLLSPLDQEENNYEECAVCNDNYAVCATVDTKTTCWCQTTYEKVNNKCQKEARGKPLVIFPNSQDINENNFIDNCENRSDSGRIVVNNLCVCKDGYYYDNTQKTCVEINRRWIDDMYEYGLCTRITSANNAIAVDGLCPAPLKCIVKKDKHVCSCGKNSFRDLDDPSKCVCYIDKEKCLDNVTCPKNAIKDQTTGICKCLDGYRTEDQNRKCVLELSSELYDSSCTTNRSNDKVCSHFGITAQFCKAGECRCSGEQSFPNSNSTRCYAPVNQTLLSSQPEICPPLSSRNGNICNCNKGYRPSSDSRRCELTIRLSAYMGIPNSSTFGDFDAAVCTTFFSSLVEVYTQDVCQCRKEATLSDTGDACVALLNTTLQSTQDLAYCPPNSNQGGPNICLCKPGYRQDGNRCVPALQQVYPENDTNALNIVGIAEGVCVTLFGSASTKSKFWNYCICKDCAYAVENNARCMFFVNRKSEYSRVQRDCPANTVVESDNKGAYQCACLPGYRASSDNRTCEPIKIDLSGNMERNESNCKNLDSNDCRGRFGDDAFCNNDMCYCDRRRSYKSDENKCVSLGKSIFPGSHEESFHSCETEADCDNQENVVCDYWHTRSLYKVCQCESGFFLDTESQKCVQNRCAKSCDSNANFECRGYECVCKNGYILVGSTCQKINIQFQLNDECNSTIWPSGYTEDTNTLECDISCGRVRCQQNYQTDQSTCVQYKLNDDECVFRESICQTIDIHSICVQEENRCLCKAPYYENSGSCATGVDAPCTRDDQCDNNMICRENRCNCNGKQRTQQIVDPFGRPFMRCINGMNKLNYQCILLLISVLICWLLSKE